MRKKYPKHTWVDANKDITDFDKSKIIICSDVIEHVTDPDQLIEKLKKLCDGYFVISTPERSLLYGAGSPYHLGPPANPTHIREWDFNEFRNYLNRHFTIHQHTITNQAQGTQTAVCSL